MNMYSVLIPANVQLVFSLIVGIVNFKIIPTDALVASLTGMKDNIKSKVSPEAAGTGYSSTNILKNIGLVLLGLLVVCVFIGALIILHYVAKRFNQ